MCEVYLGGLPLYSIQRCECMCENWWWGSVDVLKVLEFRVFVTSWAEVELCQPAPDKGLPFKNTPQETTSNNHIPHRESPAPLLELGKTSPFPLQGKTPPQSLSPLRFSVLLYIPVSLQTSSDMHATCIVTLSKPIKGG